MTDYDVIILGAGTAGLSAAIYAIRAGLKVLVLEKQIQGGQIINTPKIDNYPAMPGVSGFDFVDSLFRQATQLGAQVEYDQPVSVDFSGEEKIVVTAQGTYRSGAVIIASGASHRKLGCPGEEAFSGKGVSYCATCDGAFYQGKEVCIVGGGNTALDDALFLANSCQKVYLIHRRDEFRASKVTVDAVRQRDNIEILPFYTVQEIQGDSVVSHVLLSSVQTGETRTLPVSAVFVAIGNQPDTQLFQSVLEMDESGYLKAGENCHTSLPGVFAAGDVRTKPLRQLVTAAADGAVAAVETAAYLNIKQIG